jgi:translation initiation factor 2B subunit (eIF-2B alpha/beta/delta family)
MVHPEIANLVDRFSRLELHAAHSGREVFRVLKLLINESQETSLADLNEEVHENVRVLLSALPAYAPPFNNINRILLLLEEAEAVGLSLQDVRRRLDDLEEGAPDPVTNCHKIVTVLESVMPPGAIVYTHTLSETVLGVLAEFTKMRCLKQVNVTESRPNQDGWITATRLAGLGLEVYLTVDAAMPEAIQGADLMLSGAEVINLDGSVVGKVGASVAALCCREYGKPVYIVADTNKILCAPRKDFFLSPISFKDLGLENAPPGLQVSGSFFDNTPAALISGYATERGLVQAAEIPALAPDWRVSRWLAEGAASPDE